MWNILKIFGIIIIVAGCSINERPNNLISTPSNEKWLEELKGQLDKDLPQNYRLLTPKSNKEKQMIWLFDLQEKKEKEAVVIYKKPTENCKIYLSIYKQINGFWTGVEKHHFTGDNVDILKIGDFTGDHKDEILIGISSSNKLDKSTIYAFSVKGCKLSAIYQQNYTKLFIEDFNQNGIEDISLVNYQKNRYLKVMFIEKFNTLSEISFNPNLNSIEKIQVGWISKKNKGIVIDGGFSEHSSITYVAKFIKNRFEKIFRDEENPLVRESLVESKDVNNDGIIDFASTFKPKGWEEKTNPERPMFERYLQLKENNFTAIEERYINLENGYIIRIPKELIGKITLATNNKVNNIQRLLYAKTNETWLEVYTFKPNENLDLKKFFKILKNTSRISAIPNQQKYKKWTDCIKPLSEYQLE